jgi:hypothetical protein
MRKIALVALSGFFASVFGSDGFSIPPQDPGVRGASHVLKVSDMRRYRHRGGGMFSQWCAYNCYSISPTHHGPLGAYGYRFFAYDQDIPAYYRWDRDASAVDNVLGRLYPYTGEFTLRAFETVY